MKSETILCVGNVLAERLSNISSRGGRVEVMDTCVGGNAGYRLHVNFERVMEEPQSIQDRNPDAGHAGPAALTKSPSADASASAGQLHGRIASQTRESVTAGETAMSIEDRMAALQQRLADTGRLRPAKIADKPSGGRLLSRLPYADD